MSIRIEKGIAYVDTVNEAFEAADTPGVTAVEIQDNMERIKMNKLIKGLSRL